MRNTASLSPSRKQETQPADGRSGLQRVMSVVVGTEWLWTSDMILKFAAVVQRTAAPARGGQALSLACGWLLGSHRGVEVFDGVTPPVFEWPAVGWIVGPVYIRPPGRRHRRGRLPASDGRVSFAEHVGWTGR